MRSRGWLLIQCNMCLYKDMRTQPHRWMTMSRHRERTVIYKPRRNEPSDTLILDVQPQDREKVASCCISPPLGDLIMVAPEHRACRPSGGRQGKRTPPPLSSKGQRSAGPSAERRGGGPVPRRMTREPPPPISHSPARGDQSGVGTRSPSTHGAADDRRAETGHHASRCKMRMGYASETVVQGNWPLQGLQSLEGDPRGSLEAEASVVAEQSGTGSRGVRTAPSGSSGSHPALRPVTPLFLNQKMKKWASRASKVPFCTQVYGFDS